MVCGSGSQTRSFRYVDDLIEGLHRRACRGVHEAVSRGSPEDCSLAESAALVNEIVGILSAAAYQAMPKDNPASCQPDIAKAIELISLPPDVPLREGVARTVPLERGRKSHADPDPGRG
jgi:UDP-glucuronate decarboxylase